MRIDKWLWAVRFFKTRSIATHACELGRIKSHGQLVKPARDVKVGDILEVKTEGGLFEVEVLQLSEIRGPAPFAQLLYRETEAGLARRLQEIEQRKLQPHFETVREGRPSKRDRRKLGHLRGREY